VTCGARFTKHSKLARHTATHRNLRQHRCADCGKSFTRKEHLQRHSAVHAAVRPRPYACAECGFAFARREHLRRHARVHERKAERRQDDGATVITSPFPVVWYSTPAGQRNDAAADATIKIDEDVADLKREPDDDDLQICVL